MSIEIIRPKIVNLIEGKISKANMSLVLILQMVTKTQNTDHSKLLKHTFLGPYFSLQ